MNPETIIQAFGLLPRGKQAELLVRLEASFNTNNDVLVSDEVAVLDERMDRYRCDSATALDAERVCDEMVRLAKGG